MKFFFRSVVTGKVYSDDNSDEKKFESEYIEALNKLRFFFENGNL